MDLTRIGKNVKYYRAKAGFTQSELAEMVDLTNTHISHIETGDGTMSLDSLIEIAGALNTTPDFLLFGNMKTTLNRTAQIFMEKAKDFSQEEIECIFDIIDVMNRYKIIRK